MALNNRDPFARRGLQNIQPFLQTLSEFSDEKTCDFLNSPASKEQLDATFAFINNNCKSLDAYLKFVKSHPGFRKIENRFYNSSIGEQWLKGVAFRWFDSPKESEEIITSIHNSPELEPFLLRYLQSQQLEICSQYLSTLQGLFLMSSTEMDQYVVASESQSNMVSFFSKTCLGEKQTFLNSRVVSRDAFELKIRNLIKVIKHPSFSSDEAKAYWLTNIIVAKRDDVRGEQTRTSLSRQCYRGIDPLLLNIAILPGFKEPSQLMSLYNIKWKQNHNTYYRIDYLSDWRHYQRNIKNNFAIPLQSAEVVILMIDAKDLKRRFFLDNLDKLTIHKPEAIFILAVLGKGNDNGVGFLAEFGVDVCVSHDKLWDLMAIISATIICGYNSPKYAWQTQDSQLLQELTLKQQKLTNLAKAIDSFAMQSSPKVSRPELLNPKYSYEFSAFLASTKGEKWSAFNHYISECEVNRFNLMLKYKNLIAHLKAAPEQNAREQIKMMYKYYKQNDTREIKDRVEKVINLPGRGVKPLLLTLAVVDLFDVSRQNLAQWVRKDCLDYRDQGLFGSNVTPFKYYSPGIGHYCPVVPKGNKKECCQKANVVIATITETEFSERFPQNVFAERLLLKDFRTISILLVVKVSASDSSSSSSSESLTILSPIEKKLANRFGADFCVRVDKDDPVQIKTVLMKLLEQITHTVLYNYNAEDYVLSETDKKYIRYKSYVRVNSNAAVKVNYKHIPTLLRDNPQIHYLTATHQKTGIALFQTRLYGGALFPSIFTPTSVTKDALIKVQDTDKEIQHLQRLSTQETVSATKEVEYQSALCLQEKLGDYISAKRKTQALAVIQRLEIIREPLIKALLCYEELFADNRYFYQMAQGRGLSQQQVAELVRYNTICLANYYSPLVKEVESKLTELDQALPQFKVMLIVKLKQLIEDLWVRVKTKDSALDQAISNKLTEVKTLFEAKLRALSEEYQIPICSVVIEIELNKIHKRSLGFINTKRTELETLLQQDGGQNNNYKEFESCFFEILLIKIPYLITKYEPRSNANPNLPDWPHLRMLRQRYLGYRILKVVASDEQTEIIRLKNSWDCLREELIKARSSWANIASSSVNVLQQRNSDISSGLILRQQQINKLLQNSTLSQYQTKVQTALSCVTVADARDRIGMISNDLDRQIKTARGNNEYFQQQLKVKALQADNFAAGFYQNHKMPVFNIVILTQEINMMPLLCGDAYGDLEYRPCLRTCGSYCYKISSVSGIASQQCKIASLIMFSINAKDGGEKKIELQSLVSLQRINNYKSAIVLTVFVENLYAVDNEYWKRFVQECEIDFCVFVDDRKENIIKNRARLWGFINYVSGEISRSYNPKVLGDKILEYKMYLNNASSYKFLLSWQEWRVENSALKEYFQVLVKYYLKFYQDCFSVFEKLQYKSLMEDIVNSHIQDLEQSKLSLEQEEDMLVNATKEFLVYYVPNAEFYTMADSLGFQEIYLLDIGVL